ncbi:metabotropic glutamate receptor 5 [Caerostris extrusa]|uniref:Metabotropic glutamate receptor 5 n=1 Tax=Caerostris extrusa TaxID=172846 RepID=A0AAV4YEL5_CAEEX|nr:metabotropic glutamate receptor 5 [Caerostris extrusa]
MFHPVQITQKLSNYLLDTKKKDLEDFSSDLAFVIVGSPEEITAASSIINPLNVTTISVTDSIRQKGMTKHHLQVAVPFEKKTKAIVDTLRYLSWNYVTVIHDGDRRSTIMLESFKTYIKESEICIATELTATNAASDIEMDNLVKEVVEAKKKGARAVSFKEFENEATGVIVLKTQQGEVEDFATYYQRLQPETNRRNPWFQELWEQRKECKNSNCDTNNVPVEYIPSASTVNIIQGLLAISAGLARLRNELCHPEPGLCPKNVADTPIARTFVQLYSRNSLIQVGCQRRDVCFHQAGIWKFAY